MTLYTVQYYTVCYIIYSLIIFNMAVFNYFYLVRPSLVSLSEGILVNSKLYHLSFVKPIIGLSTGDLVLTPLNAPAKITFFFLV